MPLFWLSLAFLSGILLAAQADLPTIAWLGLAVLALGVFPLPRLFSWLVAHPPGFTRFIVSHTPARVTKGVERAVSLIQRLRSDLPLPPIPLLLCFVCLGAARYQAAQPTIQPGFIAWYNNLKSEIVIDGQLIDPPDERDSYTNLRIEVERLRLGSEIRYTEAHGRLLARVAPGEDWRYGDLIHLRGHLETPPEYEDFSYRDYLAHQGIYSYMGDAQAFLLARGQGNWLVKAKGYVYAFRQHAQETVYRLFPDPEASLLAGILLGVESGIPQDVQQAFKDTGTSHIIAISGFNITIISGLFLLAFSRLLGVRRGSVAAAVGIALYTLMVGASAAVVRAALLGGFSLLGRQVGRRQQGLNSLLIVAFIMAFITPMVLWDVGFQLSFAATLGLVLYADPLSQAFTHWAKRFLPEATVQRLAGPVGAYFLFTLAAQLTVLPIILYHFGYLSLSALFANPLILPVQPPLMILGGVSVLVGMIYRPVGQLLAYLAWPFVAYTIRTVEWLSGMPGGVINLGRTALPVVIVFYLLLFAWTFAHARIAPALQKAGIAINLKPAIPLTALALLIVITWRSAFSAPDGRLHVTVLDVGTGEAILIQTPGGRNILVDGGPSASRLSEALGRRLPPGNRRLDWLVIASPDEDGLTALPRMIERYPPDNVLWSGQTHGTYPSRQLWEALILRDIPVTLAKPGQALDLGQGAFLRFLTVGSRGTVLLLEWENFRLLLPLGLDFEALEGLKNGDAVGPVTALLLSESGYAPLNPPEWLAALRPQVVLLSVAADDRQGLPDTEVLQALEGYTLLRTDENGWIKLTTDGKILLTEVERR